MKPIKIWILAFLLGAMGLQAQNTQIADKYFKDGDFGKAYFYYEKAYNEVPSIFVLSRMVDCKQQLKDYKTAEGLILKAAGIYQTPELSVLLGYNYQLKNQPEKAEREYKSAIEAIDKNPAYAYSIGSLFESYFLPRYALQAYEKAMAFNPGMNLHHLVGKIYGELKDYPKMFDHYLDYLALSPFSKKDIINILEAFISKDSSSENNTTLRKLLLKRNQQSPNTLWNSLLSWLFMRENQYDKAFAQTKAIYLREGDFSLLISMYDMALMADENGQRQEAKKIFEYLLTTNDIPIQIKTQLKLIEWEEEAGQPASKTDLSYKALMNKYNVSAQSLPLVMAYAKFAAYRKNDFPLAKEILESSLKFPLSDINKAELKLLLGDIYVYYGKYNTALLYYAQVKTDMKNHELGQLALFKTAQTAFFKGDFDWAESQLSILKSSTYNLVSNDALRLKWIISDNNEKKDSSQTALKLYAKASLFQLRNQPQMALKTLDTLVAGYKNTGIEDDALLKRAELLQQSKAYKAAAADYLRIIEQYGNDVCADEALFNLADLYDHYLNQPEDAKRYYEQILNDHTDSIYYVPARKRYRILRGDKAENL